MAGSAVVGEYARIISNEVAPRLIARRGIAWAVLPLLGACCPERRVEQWTPSRPLVLWHHLATNPVVPVHDGYRILVPQPTSGMFPAAMAVTRVGVELVEDPALAPRACLLSDPRNELLQWNRVLDDQMAVGEVFPVIDRDLGGGPAEPGQILAAFRALDAHLGLIYAVNELSRDETEMFGVLYDTESQRALASLHAVAQSKPPVKGKARTKPEDLWTTDSGALVRAEFKRLVHACIHELIVQDESGTVQSPDGWRPAGPTRPVEWPPVPFRRGQ